jgi:hypothetical protein
MHFTRFASTPPVGPRELRFQHPPTKDLHFGMGIASTRVGTPQRQDRLWLLNAFAVALLTFLRAVVEALGYDRHLKSNTSKQRTHSLFRQVAMLDDLTPMMPEPHCAL